MREKILKFAKATFGTAPEYPWPKYPSYAVLRHQNKKWYGVIMEIPKNKIGISGEGSIEVINLKVIPLEMGSILTLPGVFPGYHMNKKHWITVLLKGGVDFEQLCFLIRSSHAIIGAGPGRKTKG